MRRLSLLGLLAACKPTGPVLIELTPEAGVAPGEVAFGDAAVPQTVSATFFVTNAGGETLTADLAVTDDAEGVFAVTPTAIEVAPHDEEEVTVTFSPSSFLDYAAAVQLRTNDASTPEIDVTLSGRGVSAPVPDIAVDPAALDFGETAVYATEVALIRNVGAAPLHLAAWRLEGSSAFALLTDPADTTVAPGDELPVVVAYTPNLAGDSGTLVLASDDGDTPEARLPLLGNGGGDFAYPVAVIDCPGQLSPPAFAAMDGFASTDPNGQLPLTYAWSVAALPTDPRGVPTSSGYLTSLSGPTTSMFVDAVGTYDVDLVVTNALGIASAPARCRLDAIPDDDLVVELTWDTEQADLDLHLAEGDAPLFAEPGSACWCSRTPEWGAAGTDDNPRLNLDDRAGRGPENISIPGPGDGTYEMRVHYFDDHGDGAVTATVRVYLASDPTPVFQASRLMNRNDVWDVGTIRWPEATVGARSTANAPAVRRACYTP
jgi:hypothetical protein